MKKIILIMLVISSFTFIGKTQSDTFKFISSGTSFKIGQNTSASGTISISPALPDGTTTISVGVSYNILPEQEYTVSGDFKELEVKNNELTSLDLSSLSTVKLVNCSSNKLTTLKITGMSKLKDINFGDNLLSSIDFSNLKDLKVVWGHANKFSEIDFSDLKKLKYMTCANNQLTHLDLENMGKLKAVWCYNNNLRSINVKNTKKLRDFRCYNNPISVCGLDSIFADLSIKNRGDDDKNPRIFIANKNANQSPNNECRTYLATEKGWRVMDLNGATGYNPSGDIEINNSEPYGCVTTFISEELLSKKEINIYPNPINDVLKIESDENIKQVSIFDISGSLVLQTIVNDLKTSIQTANLSAGVYVLKIETASDCKRCKIIKE